MEYFMYCVDIENIQIIFETSNADEIFSNQKLEREFQKNTDNLYKFVENVK